MLDAVAEDVQAAPLRTVGLRHGAAALDGRVVAKLGVPAGEERHRALAPHVVRALRAPQLELHLVSLGAWGLGSGLRGWARGLGARLGA